MVRDWVEWHRDYDDPTTSLARRLSVVQDTVRQALSVAGREAVGLRLIAMCAGDGRDVLPVLAETPQAEPLRALLVERDPDLAQRAKDRATALDLNLVQVQCCDGGVVDPYLDLSPAHIVMLCGVFGNISIEDVHITISTVAGLLTPDGVVIWTRGVDEANDVTGTIRQFFKDAGFDELTFVAPADETFRVGMHRLRTYQHVRPEVGTRMFTFVK